MRWGFSRYWKAVVTSAWVALSVTAWADVSMEIPVRPSKHQYSETEKQRIRFATTALWENAHKAIAAGQFDEAARNLEKIVESDPHNVEARVRLLNVYEMQEKRQRAIEVADSLLNFDKDYHEVRVHRAIHLVALERSDEAAAEFERVLNRAPKRFKAREFVFLQLGHIYLNAENARDAIRVLTQAEQEGIDSAEQRRMRAAAWVMAGEPDSAIRDLEAVLKQGGGEAGELAEVHRMLGTLNAEKSRWKVAIKHWSEAIRLRDEPDWRRQRLEAAVHEEEWKLALVDLDALLKKGQDDAGRGELLLRRGYALGHLRQWKESEKSLVEAIALLKNPEKRAGVQRQLALNAVASGRFDAAEHRLKAYLKDRFDPDLAGKLIAVLAELGKRDSAIELCETYAREQAKDPSSPLGRKVREYLLEVGKEEGRWQRVYELTGQLTKAYPRELRFKRERAIAAFRLERTEESRGLYAEILAEAFDPTVAVEYYFALKKSGASASERMAVLDRVLNFDETRGALRTTAQYEHAQAQRELGKMDSYLKELAGVVQENDNTAWQRELGLALYGEGRVAQAVPVLEKVYAKDPGTEEEAYLVTFALGDLAYREARYDQAETWLKKAAGHREPDLEWQKMMALVEFAQGRYRESANRLRPYEGRDPTIRLHVGFTLARMHMGGLALSRLELVDPDRIDPDKRFALFANLAVLHFEHNEWQKGREWAEKAESLYPDVSIEILKLRCLLEDDPRRTMELGEAVLKKEAGRRGQGASARSPTIYLEELTPAEARRQLHEVCGLAAFACGEDEKSVFHLQEALSEGDPEAPVLYSLALALSRLKRHEEALDALRLLASETNQMPHAAWGDLALMEFREGEVEAAVQAYRRNLDFHPHNVDSREDLAYALRRLNRNPEAREAFKAAIDHYLALGDSLEGEDREAYLKELLRDRREFTELDRWWSFQAYAVLMELNDIATSGGSVPQFVTGTLPSQAGIGAGWRPPKIGYRDRRIFALEGRVLANFEENSVRIDSDTLQGAFGGVYKPFKSSNINLRFERLFRIGDLSENNWLARVGWSYDWRQRPPPGKTAWWYGRIFGEAGYYFDDRKRWIGYLDGRFGAAWKLPQGWTLRLPQLIGVVRYESDDNVGNGSYHYWGPGIVLQKQGGATRYRTETWKWELFAYGMSGRYFDPDSLLEEDRIDGVMVGMMFAR